MEHTSIAVEVMKKIEVRTLPPINVGELKFHWRKKIGHLLLIWLINDMVPVLICL